MNSFAPRFVSQRIETDSLLIENGNSIIVYRIIIYNIGAEAVTGLDITNSDESITYFENIVLNIGGSTTFSLEQNFNMRTPFLADQGLKIKPPASSNSNVRATVFYSNVGA